MLADFISRMGLDAGRGTPAERWVLAGCLGLCGFLVNARPVAISPGVDVVLGGALVFAAYRVLSGPQFIVAFSLAAAQTVLLWGHPWAWAIWTLEGAVLASRRKSSSPVLVDVVFWLLAGSLLVWITYRNLMAMDGLSVQLAMLKQAINAVLNITLGEIIYIALGYALQPKVSHWPPMMSVGSIIMPGMVALLIMPSVLLMRIESLSWGLVMTESAQLRLNDNLDENRQRLDKWQSSYSALLIDNWRRGTTKLVAGEQRTAYVFSEISLLTPAQAKSKLGAAQLVQSRPNLVRDSEGPPNLVNLSYALPVADGKWLIGRLKPDVFETVIRPTKINKGDGLMILVDPSGEIAFASGVALPAPPMLSAILNASNRAIARIEPPRTFGTPLMNRTREAAYVKSAPVPGLEGWRLVSATWMRDEILVQRHAQAKLLSALALAIVTIAFVSILVSRAILRRLRSIADTVSKLALGGADHNFLKNVMISELAEIMTSLAINGERVSHERELLLLNRRRLESIARFAPVIIFSFDRYGHLDSPLTYISQNAEKLLGYKLSEMLKPGWWFSNVHPDDKGALGQVLRPGMAATKEYRIRHNQGHYIWIFECVAVSDDRSEEAVGVMIDISERKQIGDQLEFASRMDSLGRIAAGIAHELSQPLQVIRMAAQNIERRLRGAGDEFIAVREKLTVVKGQVDRAAKIVRQVNAFGKPVQSESRNVQLGNVIAEISALMRVQVRQADIRLICEAIEPSLAVWADPLRLEQVIINLVQNALQSILRRKQPPGRGCITVRTARSSEGVLVTIDDNGTGIAEADLPYLFEPFFTTKSAEGGTGLGLSLSYSIVKDMGGQIWAEDTGEGARFSILLKAGEPERILSEAALPIQII